MSEVGTLKEWGVDLYALQHFTQDPPDLPGGQLLIDGEPYPPEGGGGGSAHTIEDEGVDLPDRGTLNFVGAGVTATDSGTKTVVTIPGSTYTHPNHSGDVVSVADGATEIQAGVVTNAKLASMTAGRIKGRISTDGSPQDLTATEVRTLLNVADGAQANTVTSVNTETGAVVLDSDDISDTGKTHKFATAAQLAKVDNISITQPVDLDILESNVTTNNAKVTNATHTGDVTGSTSLTIASGVVSNAKLANMATKTLKGRTSGSTGAPEDVTCLQLRSFIKRTSTETSNATPTIDSDAVDAHYITALAAAITSITVTGTPFNGQLLWIGITGTATRAITMGSSFEASTVALPTTTDGTNLLDILCRWNSATSKWRVVAVA